MVLGAGWKKVRVKAKGIVFFQLVKYMFIEKECNDRKRHNTITKRLHVVLENQ